MRFSCRRQPFSALWFDLIDETQPNAASSYPERVVTGPSQSGKTLIGFVIPILYHLFEMGENVIAAVPDGDMVRDKWEADIEPVLSSTRYAALMPAGGKGSKGGMSNSIKFGNGSILRFMTAGGSDKSRAGFTSRVVCMTETDGFDVRTSTSDEADKIEQIEARMRSYPLKRRRFYKECTVSVEEGHTWRRYLAGTASRLVIPCGHCGAWVTPAREHLHGWQDAESDTMAVDGTSFHCPSCGESWSEAERVAANQRVQVVHRGQEIDADGNIIGDPPETFTLGFRWSAVNNLLVPACDVGLDEWRATRAVDEDNEERKLCQFVWAVPYKPSLEDRTKLTPEMLQRRQNVLGRGALPENCKQITVGIDTNLKSLHWTAIAWDESDPQRGYVIDYGQQPVSLQAAWHVSFDEAIRELIYKKLGTGWTQGARVDRIAIDSRWETDSVITAIKRLRDSRVRPFMGLGAGHWARSKPVPTKHNKETVWIGDQCYERVIAKHGCIVLFADANYWKTWLHSRLVLDIQDQVPAGAVTLYATSDKNPHAAFARQLTAERETIVYEQGKGYQKIWESVRSDNHYLDSTYIACVLANRFRVRKSVAVRAAPASVPAGYNDEAPTFGHSNYFQ